MTAQYDTGQKVLDKFYDIFWLAQYQSSGKCLTTSAFRGSPDMHVEARHFAYVPFPEIGRI